MPIHDWRRVEAGIFHDFRHAWVAEIGRALNGGLLPDEYYALLEQHAAGFGPEIMTLEHVPENNEPEPPRPAGDTADGSGVGLLTAPSQVRIRAETEMDFYRRKQSAVVVRHVSGDRMAAVVEVVSPGNKSGQNAFRLFLDKAGQLLERQIHLHRGPETARRCPHLQQIDFAATMLKWYRRRCARRR